MAKPARTPPLAPETPVVVAARRSPLAAPGGRLSSFSADELAAPVLPALLADLGPRRPGVDEVILGTGFVTGNVARVAALRAGLGVDVPGVTVDRQDGSGLEAIRLAATLVRAGELRLALAGGADSASTQQGDPPRLAPEPYADPGHLRAAESLASRLHITRRRLDAYAARSHRLAAAARARGRFGPETVMVAGVAEDDWSRTALTLEELATLRPVLAARGSTTVGNSSEYGDGAAAVAVVSERVRAILRIPGLAVTGGAVAGVDPELPGLGPLAAVADALDRAGRSLREVGQVELAETSAAQVLACTDTWGLDPLGESTATQVCPEGGALALGHPCGAAGALLVVRLFATMVRDNGPRIGVAACAARGGQGVALVLERVG